MELRAVRPSLPRSLSGRGWRHPLFWSKWRSYRCFAWLCLTLLSLSTLAAADPEFTQPSYNATIPENSVGKTYVTPSEKMGIFVSDSSLVVRYKIVEGDNDRFFKAEVRHIGDFYFLLVRTRTGNYAVLNREYQDRYQLTVRATITSLQRRSVKLKAQTVVHVHILDTNDLNPLFYPTDYDITVREDTPLHRSIMQVSAFDADIGVNGEIYYSLSEMSVQFAVHPTRGILTLTRPLDFQQQSYHELTIVAEDRGPKFRAGDVRASVAKIRVKVTPVNLYAPEIFVRHFTTAIDPSGPAVYVVVKVADKDQGVHGEIDRLEITDGDPTGNFRIAPGSKQNEYNVELQRYHTAELTSKSYSLTLRATDRGTPPRSTVQVITIKVTDLSDQLPVFEQSTYEVQIEEVAPRGSHVFRVAATVFGGVTDFVYRIETGNKNATFAINPRSGLIRTVQPLDREVTSKYSLTISAVNKNDRRGSKAKKGTTVVDIQVVDNNDNDPVFNHSFAVVVFDENRPIGSVVYTVHATDRDEGDNGYVTYSLANLTPVPFTVDYFTGEVKTTDVLDYEVMRREHTLKVRASDWGAPYRRQAEMTLKIKLRDVNDHRPLFEKVDCIGYVADTAPLNTEILTLSAIDFDAGNIVTYRMVPSNDDPCFRLNPSTGVMSITCDLAEHQVRERTLNVSATDGQHFADVMAIQVKVVSSGGSQRLAGQAAIVECRDVGVTDRLKDQIRQGEANNRGSDVTEPTPTSYEGNKHAPEFPPTLLTDVWINESVALGSEVANLRARDKDHGYSGRVVYVVSGGDEEVNSFMMEMYSGRLVVASPLDRERTDTYTLNITALDLGHPQKTASHTLVVHIHDVNDNTPLFEKMSYNFVVPENVLNGTSIVRLRATDSDIELNAELIFALETDMDDFHIDPETGLLTVHGPLDRERVDLYHVRVRVSDSSPTRPLSSTTLVNIRVLDNNDNPPTFSLSQYWVKVREDMPLGAVVIVMAATDPDLEQGGEVRYRLTTGDDGAFVVDPLMGVVRLARRLDFEDKQMYNISVVAKDGGEPSLSATAFLIVEVEDVNENVYAPHFSDVVAVGSVKENLPAGTDVMKTIARDEDEVGINGQVVYSIRDGDGMGLFSIDSKGIIRTRSVLDRETSPRYWLTIFAHDRGAVPLSARLDVYIEVLDENDNIPLTVEPAYYPSIVEHAPPDTSVVKVDAFDLDANPDGRLHYSISSGDPQGFFFIDANTGLITTTSRRLDRESQAQHTLEVTVSDGGKPALSSVTRVVVTVIDINDHSPRFLLPLYRCPVPEIEVHHSEPLCQIGAVDEDDGINSNITYTLIEGRSSSRFTIHPETGTIYPQSTLAAADSYDLHVKATDGGQPQRSATTRVLVEVVPRPKGSPHPPVVEDMEFQAAVAENDIVGHLVALVQAKDPDGDRLWYSIVGGNVGDVFMIQPDVGVVLVAQPLDSETRPEYSLNISITDGVHIVYQMLQVKVIDVNDNQPEFSQEMYTVDISENVYPYTEILQLVATDADKDKRLFYSIYNSASPQSLQTFHIDSTRGVLSVIQSLDHEAMQQHILTVMVKDHGTPSKRSFCRVIINVQDQNDHAPQFLTSIFEGSVYETAAVGTSVTQVLAVDKDKGMNAQLSFSIVSGNVGNAFSIDSSLGIILVAKELNRRTLPEYYLVVRAADHGIPVLNSTVTVHIIVTVANNAPPKFEHEEYAVEIYENKKPGTSVVSLHATSRSSVYYEIVAGNVGDSFVINPTSGVISTNKMLDYEETKFYNLTARATNMVGVNSSVFALVHVLDKNDNSPFFLHPEYFGEVSESAKVGSVVLTNQSYPLVAVATDKDSGLNAVLTYKIVEKYARKYFTIDANTGAVRTANALDYEKMSDFTFTVQVWDMGHPSLNAEVPSEVHVTITDVNDCPPYFEHSHYNAVLMLPTYKGVFIINVKALDLDSVTSIKYTIMSGNSGNKFLINENTGDIMVNDPNGLGRKYTLVISASDGEFETSTKVAIKVQDTQSSGLRFSQQKYHATVPENSTDVHTVTVITVVGTLLHEHLVFNILNPSKLFEIGRTSGVIRTTGIAFDRESRNSYTLVVEVQSEAAEESKVGHILVEITVLDVNDNAPIFVNLPYYAIVPLEAQPGVTVIKVEAMDHDVGLNGEIHYQLVEADSVVFGINGKTGDILLTKPLTGEKYEITAAAVDGGDPQLVTHAAVVIKVVSRDMPVFPQQYYSLSVPENLQAHAPVITITANSPQGRQLIYNIVAGSKQEDFGLDFNTEPTRSSGPCVMYVVEELDFETTHSYSLTLRATDAITGTYSDVPINIKVQDVNDNPPMFTQPSYNTTVSEAAPFGTSILQVKATDRDTGINRRVQYHIVGNSTIHFHVDPSEGIIFIKQSLDHESQREHHFIVMATDGGNPILSSTALVWVTVADMNDNPPRFNHPTYNCVISEQAQRGQFVTMVAASDPDSSDQTQLLFSIVGGNELQAFRIDRKSGIIQLSNLHQFASQDSYSLNISVTDGVHSNHASVNVIVIGANSHSPRFTRTVYEVALQENSQAGLMVVAPTANDEDRGDYGHVKYEIQCEECEKVFHINADTGEIHTKKSLDREKRHLYEVPISAIDSGGRISYTTVRVTVTDSNDNVPQFAVASYKTTVPANMTVGTTILRVQAVDRDDGLSATVEYSLYKTNNSAIPELFGITHDNGEIYLRKPALGQENYIYQFFVQACDRGTPSQEAVVPVNIIVVDSKEALPHFENFRYEFFLSEKALIGSIVSTLNISYEGPVRYFLMPATKGSEAELYSSKFSIDEQGRVLLMAELDHEQQAEYFLSIGAETVDMPTRVTCADVTIRIMDENDNAPQFVSDPYIITVAENIEEDASILRVIALDPDVGKNGDVTYHFGPDVGEIANIFHLDTKTGWLTTMVALDREVMPWYNFTVIAQDFGSPSLFSTAFVIIQIQDYNDNPPRFHLQQYNTAVDEDALPGTVIVTVTTIDDDEVPSSVEFYITDGNPQDQFQIHPSGEVYVNKLLDREECASYLLEITVTDGIFVSKTLVSVDVLDVNDNPPVCLKTKYTELVSESIAPQTYILTVEASDPDNYKNSQLRYSLTGTGTEDFAIDSVSGFLKTAKGMDRERQPRYLLTAHVQDQGHPEWECTSLVEVLLSDVNDNAPTFTQEMYSVSVPEDSKVGTLVTKVHATDSDLGPNRKISYSFVDSAHGHFSIDETTGIIRLNKAVDREEQAMYNLTVQASDHGTPQLSSLATLLVLVQDINDNPPEFAVKMYAAMISEVAAVGTEVIRVLATSKDSGINAEITYSITEGNDEGTFNIHPKSGVVSVSKPLDWERVQQYSLIIQAIDGGTPPLSNQVLTNISITDANDNAPAYSQSSYNVVIREDAIIGDKIIQVIASDADSPPNAFLTYSIVGGDRYDQFVIDNDVGYISLTSTLDREKISSYILEVKCEDSGDPPLSSTTLVNIEVSDVNDNPPLFSDDNYTAIIQEGKPLGFTVLKFTVTDFDSPPNTGPFTFDILSGNEDNAFRLVQQDATLRTAIKFDHKYRSKYLLHVKVSDSGVPQLTSDTWITVLVIEESQYAPIVTPLDVSVNSYLDEFPGGVMGRIHATDQDPYDKLVYHIVSSHSQLFTMDREDGTLVALPGLDVGTYDVNVSISDGKFTTYTTVAVEVTMVTEDALQNSIAIRLDDVTPEDFLLTYRKGFLRGLRNILNVRMKDVEIISLQPTLEDSARQKRSTQQDLDIVFAVHKASHGFYPPKLIRAKVKEKKEVLESNVGLKVVKIMDDRCTKDKCINGQCQDRIILDKAFAISITTDAFSYVSPQHYRKLECLCDSGYGGPICDMVINECAHHPCPPHRVCSPDINPLGYVCHCPPGKTGPLCNRDKGTACNDPTCYEEKTPVSFGGKSYASYTLSNPIDRHLGLALYIKTKQPTGNLMYAAGARDYSILELVSGVVQYRFDCGSGEGLVRVEKKKLNDGHWHGIRIERRGSTAEVVVDDRFHSSGNAPGSHEVLNLDGNDVYFGAEVHPHSFANGYEDVRMGFLGCLDDIRIDGVTLPLHVSSSNPIAILRRFANVEFHCGVLFDPGVCGSQPCQNGGSCKEVGSTFTCHCLPRFLGSRCEVDTNPCASNPCLNGGTCRNINNNFNCDCPIGLNGQRCDYGRYCNPNPCHNGGICEEGTFGPICKCQGYHGELCQYDVDECQTNPCGSGATCINLQASFQCQCPPNMTGPLCTDHQFTTSITSSSWNTTIEEVIGISLVVIFILLLAMVLVCCWRYRHKRQQLRPNNEILDIPSNDFLLKTPVIEKDNLNRIGKISNLEATTFTTPPLPPRPASYTPSTQDSVTALNNFDTVRSYGSAADDLESFPRHGSDYLQNISKPSMTSVAPSLPPLPPSGSDNDSVSKGGWEQESSKSKDKLYEDKVHKELHQSTKSPDISSTLTAINTFTAPLVPSRGPSSLGVPSVLSLNSVDDLPGYIWDCSDWATSQKPLPNIVEVSTKEVRDSSSVPSTESNSHASQIELLPSKDTDTARMRPLLSATDGTQPESEDLDLPESEYVGDSENNDNEFEDGPPPNFEHILAMVDLEFADEGADSLPSSPLKYQRHPNQYLPPHSFAGTADASPDHSWTDNRRHISDLSDDDGIAYGFPPQGGRGFHLDPEGGDFTRSSGLDSMSMSVGGYTSTNVSCSDISGVVCEIEDSEANFSDVDCDGLDFKPSSFSSDRFCSTHL